MPDATAEIREMAASFEDVDAGTACNQASFKRGKKSFLFIGPGAKGVGHKAMFKLGASMAEAEKLASAEPHRFEVGSTGWVTVRFSDDAPLPKATWKKWLKESYELCQPPVKKKKAAAKKQKKAAARTVKKSLAKRKTAKRKS